MWFYIISKNYQNTNNNNVIIDKQEYLNLVATSFQLNQITKHKYWEIQ